MGDVSEGPGYAIRFLPDPQVPEDGYRIEAQPGGSDVLASTKLGWLSGAGRVMQEGQITEDGFEVTLAHPSYSEVVSYLRNVGSIYQSLSAANRQQFSDMLENTLYFIRKIVMPGGIVSSNMFQHFNAILMMNQESLDLIQKEAEEMRKKILHPKFGIRSATCPHCGKENKDIQFGELTELVFYHTTLSRIVKKDSTTQSENG